MNPLELVPLLAYTTVAVMWPAQIDAHRRGRVLLLVEAVIVLAALVVGQLLAKLVTPSPTGYRWGGVGLYATGYLYVCIRGIVLVRSVLELPALQMRRDEDRTAGAIDMGVIQSALGDVVPGADAVNQISFVHGAPR